MAIKKSDKSADDRYESLHSSIKYVNRDTVSDEQYGLLIKLEEFLHPNNNNLFFGFSGGPGTGKSHIIGIFSNILRNNNFKLIGAAFTGQAVNNMKNKGISNSYTLHSLVLKRIRVKYDILLLDEVSMVPDELIDFNGNKYNTKDLLLSIANKVIVYGDSDQLDPINAKPFFDLKNKAEYKLTQNHRQKENNSILEFAKLWRDNRIDEAINLAYGNPNIEVEYCNYNEIEDKILDYYLNNIDIHSDILKYTILTSTRDLSRIANKVIREYKNYTRYCIYDEEPIIYKRNNHSIKASSSSNISISNGTRGLAFNYTKVNDNIGAITLVTDNDDVYNRIKINISRLMNTLEKYYYENVDDKDLECVFGYASTIHVSQGKEYEGGLIILSPEMTANDIIYVGLTRFKKYVKMIILRR